jgi:hypothetical protein
MSTQENARARHPVLWTLGALVALAIAYAVYLVVAPDATAFAQGKRVALPEYRDMTNSTRRAWWSAAST